VIQKKPKPVIIKGDQYLEYEDWQLISEFDGRGYMVKTHDAIPVEVDGVKGAKAAADLYDRDGNIVGGAEGYCMQDEDNWKSKPWFQLASMAQTRAGAKAFRNKFSFVTLLAGIKSTPAEEMDGRPVEREPGEEEEKSEKPPTEKPWEDFQEWKGEPITQKQLGALHGIIKKKEITENNACSMAFKVINRQVEKFANLNRGEGSALIDFLQKLG